MRISNLRSIALEAAVGPVDGIVAGHSGIPFHRWIGRHHWINAGVIGLPPHDGRRQTRFALLKDNDVTFHRLAYDHAAARAAMETKGPDTGLSRNADQRHLAVRRGIARCLAPLGLGQWVVFQHQFLQPVFQDVGVNLGRGDIGVAQKRLDRTQIRAV